MEPFHNQTWPLYDPGEEFWPVKIHAGCGGIYLDGYTNVDVQGKLAAEHPELVKANRTDIRAYYARLEGTAEALPTRRETVCDVLANLEDWFPGPSSWNKIVALQVLEHFSPRAGLRLLTGWRTRMETVHGTLALSVPDMDGTLKMLEVGTPAQRTFALRHLRGSGRDEYNWHKAWYTEETLRETLWQAGYTSVTVQRNVHIYPALVFKAIA